MKYLKWMGGLCLMAALLMFPETAVNAAREAMLTWAKSVAPALFPFMALMPLLTCESAVNIYEKLFGRLMRPLFGLPGAAAPAAVIAMTAGSPAGAVAAASIAARSGMTRGELERTAACVCGAGPAFLIGGVGTAMLGEPAAGRMLLRAQLITQIVLLLLTRKWPKGESIAVRPHEQGEQDSIRAAAGNLLAVCGYMIMFSTAAALIARFLRSEQVGAAVLCLMDLPSGAKTAAGMNLAIEEKLVLLAAMTGFSGLCINAQNLSACGKTGVRPAPYLLLRAASGLICAGIMAISVGKPTVTIFNISHPMAFSAMIACFFAGIAGISLGNTSFLNKRKSDKIRRKSRKNQEKPQDIVADSEVNTNIV